MGNRGERYRPSGFFRPQVIGLFAVATVAGGLCAWLYQFLLREIPFLYVNLLLAFGFAGLLAAGAYYAIKRGHCRNPMVAILLALPLAAVPLAASHFFEYRHVISEVTAETPGAVEADVLREIPFGEYLEIKKRAGWKLDSSTITGEMVTVIWGIEALIFFGVVLAGAVMGVGEPYCEKCNRWCDPVAFRLHGVGRAEAEPVLHAGDLGALADLKASPGADAAKWIEIQLKRCGGCTETGFLSVTEKQVVQKGKRANEKSKRLARHLVLDAAARDKLLARYQGLAGQKLSAAG